MSICATQPAYDELNTEFKQFTLSAKHNFGDRLVVGAWPVTRTRLHPAGLDDRHLRPRQQRQLPVRLPQGPRAADPSGLRRHRPGQLVGDQRHVGVRIRRDLR
ncbi:hypothetical protein ACRAWD_18580 [Caulobacter segnis]